MNTAWAPASVALWDMLGVLAGAAHALFPESTALDILECFYPFFPEQSASSFLFRRKVDDETMTQKNDLISPRSLPSQKEHAVHFGVCLPEQPAEAFLVDDLSCRKAGSIPRRWEQGLQSL